MGWRRPISGTVLCALTVLTACGSSGDHVLRYAPNQHCPVKPVPIVVTVDQWGDIVQRLAGSCGDVTTIVSGASIDPHDYEPSPADSAAFTSAELVVLNGLGYDAWAEKALGTLSKRPVVVDAGAVVGLAPGANPHVWYGPEYVMQVSDAITAALKSVRPEAADALDGWHDALKASLEPYLAEIATVHRLASGATYAATESVFDYMARSVGLTDVTPTGYEAAATNESQPAPGDIAAFDRALADKKVDVLVYNTQTEGALTSQLRRAADAAGVPVVEVTETLADGAHGFVDWQVRQLQRLAEALQAAG